MNIQLLYAMFWTSVDSIFHRKKVEGRDKILVSIKMHVLLN